MVHFNTENQQDDDTPNNIHDAMLELLSDEYGNVDSDGSAHAVARLAAYFVGELEELPKREMNKWQRLGVMTSDGRVRLEDPKEPAEWIVLQGVWKGFFERVPIHERDDETGVKFRGQHTHT